MRSITSWMAFTQAGLLTRGFIVSGSNSQALSDGMLAIGGRPIGDEVIAEPAPLELQRIEEAVGVGPVSGSFCPFTFLVKSSTCAQVVGGSVMPVAAVIAGSVK